MKIEHLAIWAEDLDLLCAFYANYFGAMVSPKYHNPKRNFSSCFLSFSEVGEDADHRTAGCKSSGGARIEVMHTPCMDAPASRGNVGGLAHFAISVGGNEAVDALTKRLRTDGYTVQSEPRTTGDGYYESVVLDPEGNLLEITADSTAEQRKAEYIG